MRGSKFLLAFAEIMALYGFARAQSAPAPRSNPQKTQDTTESAKPPTRKPQTGKPATGQPSTPLVLKDVGPASTEGVAASAARDLATRKDAETKDRVEDRDKNRARDGSALPEDAVVEFHAVSPGAGAEASAAASPKDRSHAASRVHGELYGAARTGGRAAAESVGVTSRDKKTSVYAGSDQTRSEPSQSH